jgi:predicted transcriptional regulator
MYPRAAHLYLAREITVTVTQTSELTPDVQMLLHAHIESYEQLEMLLLMRGNTATPWTQDALSERLHMALSLVQAALEGLKSAGFVEGRVDGGAKHYSYLGQSEGMEATLSRLAAAYRENPIPIVKVMSANSLERLRTAALRTFADAFVLRKDKDRG